MSYITTFSTKFPVYHPRAGQPTYFVEKIIDSLVQLDLYAPDKENIPEGYFNNDVFLRISPKYHTIRAGHRFKVGDHFTPKIWSGKPYRSPQITIAPDIKIEKIWSFIILKDHFRLNDELIKENQLNEIALNDGLSKKDLLAWFQYPKPFAGQIICWNPNIKY